MCETAKQFKYQCTIVWSGGHIEQTLPPEWVFAQCALELAGRVELRWQVVKNDPTLYVKDFRVLDIRLDVQVSDNQILV
jgi:hypothetical protein